MSDKSDHEARKMYDDAIEVIIVRTFTNLTYRIYGAFSSDRGTSYILCYAFPVEFVSILI